MSNDVLIGQLNSIIDELGKQFQEKYEFSIFDISIKPLDNGIQLTGRVLSKKQHETLLHRVKEFYGDFLEDSIIVLETSLENKEYYQLLQPESLIEVWRTLAKDKLASHILSNDPPFTVLERHHGMVLIQSFDLCMGWIQDLDLEQCKKIEKVDNTILRPPLLITSDQEYVVRSHIWGTAKSTLGAKYLLGGRSLSNGIDCSGLCQYAYYHGCGILLPRHSTDQMKAGIRSTLADGRQGDLIFLRDKKSSFSHAGVFSGHEENLLLHAAREKGKVVCETLDVVFQRYNLMGVRHYILEK